MKIEYRSILLKQLPWPLVQKIALPISPAYDGAHYPQP